MATLAGMHSAKTSQSHSGVLDNKPFVWTCITQQPITDGVRFQVTPTPHSWRKNFTSMEEIDMKWKKRWICPSKHINRKWL